MKTIANKTKMAFVLAVLALGMNAQTTRLKKACVKVVKEDNGVVTKMDTCVTGATDAELNQKLKTLGLADVPELPELPETPPAPATSVPPVPPVPPLPPLPPEADEDGKTVTITKTIIVDNGNDDNSGSRNKVKVISMDGKDDQVIVTDEYGNIISSDATGTSANVVVKRLKKGEHIDAETEKILKDNNITITNGAEGKQVIISSSKTKDGKQNKRIKVYIFKNVEVNTLTAADKKQLPADASNSIAKASPFTNLVVAPNPTDDACTITYQPTSKEPLQIKVYDVNGKTVYTEIEKNVSEQVNKTLSLKSLGDGAYFIHLSQGKQSEIRKIIVNSK
jgi:hypothetical protein